MQVVVEVERKYFCYSFLRCGCIIEVNMFALEAFAWLFQSAVNMQPHSCKFGVHAGLAAKQQQISFSKGD